VAPLAGLIALGLESGCPDVLNHLVGRGRSLARCAGLGAPSISSLRRASRAGFGRPYRRSDLRAVCIRLRGTYIFLRESRIASCL